MINECDVSNERIPHGTKRLKAECYNFSNICSILIATNKCGNFMLLHQNNKHIYYVFLLLKKAFEDKGVELQKDIFNTIIKYIEFDHYLTLKTQK